MKKIAIGIIGCGKIAQMRHIPEYAANANAKLCGFFDVNLQRAQELADQYGTKAYGSYQCPDTQFYPCGDYDRRPESREACPM